MRQTTLSNFVWVLNVFHPFTRLPRELRDEIYKHYFTLPGGYSFDIVSKKLVASNGQHIDFSLRFTCRDIAAETRGVALGSNTIHFSPADDYRVWNWAGRVGAVMEFRQRLDERMIIASRGFMTPELVAEITSDYPQYRATMEAIMVDETFLDLFQFHKGEAISTQRKFLVNALDILSRQHGYATAVKYDLTWSRLCHTSPDVDHALDLRSYPLWKILEESRLEYAWAVADRSCNLEMSTRYDNCKKHRFSAAAVAIQFLDKLEMNTRIQVRGIHLDEDCTSVAFPETHIQGLIPFCLENPLLRIHRRVSLWSNVLASTNSILRRNFRGEPFEEEDPREDDDVDVEGCAITDVIWPWIAEVLALPAAGMPPSCFTFMFDCESIPNRTKEVFSIMQQDAAWQLVHQEAYEHDIAEGILPDATEHEPLRWPEPIGFQTALQDIASGTSVIKCNFEVGTDVDPQSLLNWYGTWSEEKWAKHCATYVERIDTEPPLPKLIDIRDFDIITYAYSPEARWSAWQRFED